MHVLGLKFQNLNLNIKVIKLQIVIDAEFQIKWKKINIFFGLINATNKCVIPFNENMGGNSSFDIYLHKQSYHYLSHTTQFF